MSEELTRKTVGVYIGSVKNPVKVLMGTTSFEGAKKGKSPGTIFLSLELTESQVKKVENIPAIKEMLDEFKAMAAKNNAPLKEQLAALEEQAKNGAPVEDAINEIKKKIYTYKSWATPIYEDPEKGNYNIKVNEKGEKLYEVRVKQHSLKRQLSSGKSIDECFYVTHFVKNSSGQFEKRLDANGKPEPIQTYSGSLVAVKINTLLAKYPSENKYTLSTSRLVEVWHIVDATGGGVEDVNSVFDDDDEMPEIVEVRSDKAATETATTENTTTNETNPYTQQTSEANPYDMTTNKNNEQASTSAPTEDPYDV